VLDDRVVYVSGGAGVGHVFVGLNLFDITLMGILDKSAAKATSKQLMPPKQKHVDRNYM
jgi:hypothetical protein